jgi:hypothetical protein
MPSNVPKPMKTKVPLEKVEYRLIELIIGRKINGIRKTATMKPENFEKLKKIKTWFH